MSSTAASSQAALEDQPGTCPAGVVVVEVTRLTIRVQVGVIPRSPRGVCGTGCSIRRPQCFPGRIRRSTRGRVGRGAGSSGCSIEIVGGGWGYAVERGDALFEGDAVVGLRCALVHSEQIIRGLQAVGHEADDLD